MISVGAGLFGKREICRWISRIIMSNLFSENTVRALVCTWTLPTNIQGVSYLLITTQMRLMNTACPDKHALVTCSRGSHKLFGVVSSSRGNEPFQKGARKQLIQLWLPLDEGETRACIWSVSKDLELQREACDSWCWATAEKDPPVLQQARCFLQGYSHPRASNILNAEQHQWKLACPCKRWLLAVIL